MLEKLIEQLIDIWNRNGNIDVGFIDENGVYKIFNGYTILPKHNTIIYRNEYGAIENSYHMKTIGEKSVVLF